MGSGTLASLQTVAQLSALGSQIFHGEAICDTNAAASAILYPERISCGAQGVGMGLTLGVEISTGVVHKPRAGGWREVWLAPVVSRGVFIAPGQGAPIPADGGAGIRFAYTR